MKKLVITTMSAAAMFIAVEVAAQGGMGGGAGGMGGGARPDFATVDTDGNQILSAAELEAAGASGMLGRVDSDSNGEISLEEFNNAPQGGGGMGGGMGG